MTTTSDSHPYPSRSRDGRFLPGRSGNPAGKRPGTRNRATVLAEALREGEAERVARAVIDKALAGNSVAARFVIVRLVARPRDRAIELNLPDGAGASDVVAAHRATVAAMMTGEITPEEALTVTRVLDFRLKAVKAAWKEASRATKTQISPSRRVGPSTNAQEGCGKGAVAEPATQLRQPPRPPIATSMGRSLVHQGRAEIRGDLLHSTGISSQPGWRVPPSPPCLTGLPLAA